jgi:hypothetical protein
MGNIAGSAFRYYKLTLVKIGKEIAAAKKLHNNLDVVLVFKHVEKLNDTWMLADLQHFDFSLK